MRNGGGFLLNSLLASSRNERSQFESFVATVRQDATMKETNKTKKDLDIPFRALKLNAMMRVSGWGHGQSR